MNLTQKDINNIILFANNTYDKWIKTLLFRSSITSKILERELIYFLDNLDYNKTFVDSYQKKFKQYQKDTLKINDYVYNELSNAMGKLKNRLTDLNSIVMGVPNLLDSDLDFIIAVKNNNEHKTVSTIVKSLGYKLNNIYDNDGDLVDALPWHSYQKYVDGVEIEVKIRDKRVVDNTLIAHEGIKNSLSNVQKLLVSIIKTSLVASGNKKEYKKFKYILYSAMFQGHPKSRIFQMK